MKTRGLLLLAGFVLVAASTMAATVDPVASRWMFLLTLGISAGAYVVALASARRLPRSTTGVVVCILVAVTGTVRAGARMLSTIAVLWSTRGRRKYGAYRSLSTSFSDQS